MLTATDPRSRASRGASAAMVLALVLLSLASGGWQTPAEATDRSGTAVFLSGPSATSDFCNGSSSGEAWTQGASSVSGDWGTVTAADTGSAGTAAIDAGWTLEVCVKAGPGSYQATVSCPGPDDCAAVSVPSPKADSISHVAVRNATFTPPPAPSTPAPTGPPAPPTGTVGTYCDGGAFAWGAAEQLDDAAGATLVLSVDGTDVASLTVDATTESLEVELPGDGTYDVRLRVEPESGDAVVLAEGASDVDGCEDSTTEPDTQPEPDTEPDTGTDTGTETETDAGTDGAGGAPGPDDEDGRVAVGAASRCLGDETGIVYSVVFDEDAPPDIEGDLGYRPGTDADPVGEITLTVRDEHGAVVETIVVGGTSTGTVPLPSLEGETVTVTSLDDGTEIEVDLLPCAVEVLPAVEERDAGPATVGAPTVVTVAADGSSTGDGQTAQLAATGAGTTLTAVIATVLLGMGTALVRGGRRRPD